MKVRIIPIALSIMALFSCKTEPDIPDTKDITEIIIETIKQDSLDKNIPIDIQLVNWYNYKLEYYDGDLELLIDLPPSTNKDEGEAFKFYRYKSNSPEFLGFEEADSIFVARQIDKNKGIVLDTTLLPDDVKVKKEGELKSYEFLLPLFNKDKNFAIVEYGYMSPGSGYGWIIFFRKIEGKWLKIESFKTWLS